MKKAEIKFGYEYGFYGSEFEGNLRDALDRDGYELTRLDYGKHGQGGAIFVDGDIVGNDHPIHAAISLAEEWTDMDAVE